jgi:hypothetical protein
MVRRRYSRRMRAWAAFTACSPEWAVAQLSAPSSVKMRRRIAIDVA